MTIRALHLFAVDVVEPFTQQRIELVAAANAEDAVARCYAAWGVEPIEEPICIEEYVDVEDVAEFEA